LFAANKVACLRTLSIALRREGINSGLLVRRHLAAALNQRRPISTVSRRYR
jgi:hypothetical protein